ncbi:hypothetical protein FJ251_09480 [bacterium]|nr:hypothetical protein [bacterium]
MPRAPLRALLRDGWLAATPPARLGERAQTAADPCGGLQSGAAAAPAAGQRQAEDGRRPRCGLEGLAGSPPLHCECSFSPVSAAESAPAACTQLSTAPADRRLELLQTLFCHGLLSKYDFHRTVLALPHWPEIYCTDAERDHSFEHAARVHEQLVWWYRLCGYSIYEVARLDRAERARHVVQLVTSGAT